MLPLFKYEIAIDRHLPIKMVDDWCYEHFGKWRDRFYAMGHSYYFKNQEDATLFLLRWG